MKEAFLRERVAQLEAEVRDTNRRNADLEDDAKKVELLQRDVALYKARIEDLERDFMKIDVLGMAEAAGGDEQLQKAWEIASTFKKRFMEHKGELDNIRIMYARMQAQLDETHKLLHEEHRKRFKLEDEITRLNVELMRVQDLESRLSHEKGERVKLEREYLFLQQKALNAPGEALAEVRSLREELFAVKREKAQAQQKEAEIRMELSHLRALLDGMELSNYRTMQDDHDAMKKKLASVTLELQACREKLAVYMRTNLPTSEMDVLLDGDDDLLLGGDRKPDSDKTREELIKELTQLRDVWRLDQGEIKKLHKVLETESAITMEAKAALEEAHREMERVKRDLMNDMKKLEREIERREERIRKLELQLRGAYSGINRALRSSGRGLRDSLRSDTDDFSELGEDQNIFELHVTEAQVYEESLGKDPSVFFTFDFFMHETQATPIVASNTPNFNTIIQYVVDNDPFLLEYMDTHVVVLELCRARGYDYDVLGMARLPLRQVLEDLEIGAALGYNRAYHYADVFGADGKRLGRVRYGYCFRRPLDGLLKEYKLQARSKRASEPDERDPATAAVQQALNQPGNTSCIKVIVERCEGLVPAGGSTLTIKPYVHYRFPGHRDYHDTRTLAGTNPVFNDEEVWPIARTAVLEADLKTRHMPLVVFDDAQGDDPMRAIVGVASIPMASLAAGVPVEGAFKLTNPITKRPAGRIILGLGWHNPLQLPGTAPQAPPPRVPISSELMDGGPLPGQGQDVQELFPVGGPQRINTPLSGPGGLQLPRPGPMGQRPQGPGAAYESHGLLAELGGPAARRPSGDGFGLAAETRPGQQHQQPHYGQGQQQPYPGAAAGYGMAAEMAARQQQSPLRPGAPYGQQIQAPASEYGLGAEAARQDPYGQPAPYGQRGQQQSDYGLGAEAARQDPYGQQPAPYGQQGMMYGQQGPPQYGRQGPPGQQLPPYGGQQQPYGQQPQYGQQVPPQQQQRPYGQQPQYGQQQHPYGQPQQDPYSQQRQGHEDFGLAAESGGPQQQPPPYGSPIQRQGSFGRPPAGPGGIPPQGPSRLGQAGGYGPGPQRPSDGQYGLEAEPGPMQRGGAGAGNRPLARQPSGGMQHGPGGDGGFGLGAELEDAGITASPPKGMMLQGRGSSGQRTRYPDTDMSMESTPTPHAAAMMAGGQQLAQPLPPDAALGPVLRREQPDPATWTGTEYRLVLCLHSISLTQETLRNPRIRNVVLMHSLLSDQAGISDMDTCTQPVPKGPGELPLGYCVSYNLMAGTASSELLSALSSDDFSLEVKLMSTGATRLDMNSIAQPGTLQTAGFCMLPLADIWAGSRGNLRQERFEVLEDSDDMAHVATVTVSLVAEAALRTLRQHGGRR